MQAGVSDADIGLLWEWSSLAGISQHTLVQGTVLDCAFCF